MYRIGEFSYLFQVSQKTLRHYDKIGLFVPSYVDNFTGYRYYNEEQIAEFEKILQLKSLNFSLEEIKNMKDNFTEEMILNKIETLKKEQDILSDKINHLKKLKGEDNMKYEIGVTYDKKIEVVGMKIIADSVKEELLDEHFLDIEKKIDTLKLNTNLKVVIFDEVGYKEEDVELFLGFECVIQDRKKLYSKIKKAELDIFSYPTSDYLVAINVDKADVNEACQNMIKYASANEIQILGPFMQIHDLREDKICVYALAHDLNKKVDVFEKISEEKRKISLNEFKDNSKILGKWKIKEILPNVSFNPKHQKSVPETKYETLEIMENGSTNYDNVRWTGDYLIIKNENYEVDNYIHYFKIDDVEYLEIRMSDMTEIYENAKPISYIYERD